MLLSVEHGAALALRRRSVKRVRRMWGKKLVASFEPLPQRASYVEKKDDLLFDGSRTLQRDVGHILLDNIDRLPKAFLAEELRGADDAIEALDKTMHAEDDTSRRAAYDELREAVEDNVRIKRRLINRLDDAIELAQKRVEWNFKTAVPAFYPTKNTMSLLLPLDLTENEQPDVALVVELMESGAYIGQTILTMKMAYNKCKAHLSARQRLAQHVAAPFLKTMKSAPLWYEAGVLVAGHAPVVVRRPSCIDSYSFCRLRALGGESARIPLEWLSKHGGNFYEGTPRPCFR